MKKNIAIMGCGWLGLPLAKKFVSDGHHVTGSTSSNEKLPLLAKEAIDPYNIVLSEDAIDGDITSFLKNSEVLIINVPPRLRSNPHENYVRKMLLVLEAISSSTIKKVIFVSSTSVYGDIDGEVTETTLPQPSTESGKQLLECEQMFKNQSNIETTIIRFGGLIGPNRNPVTMLSKKKNLKNGNYPINLIHLSDCIGIISSIVEKGWWSELFNGVYPYHPSKKEYYTSQATKLGIQKPEYKESNKIKGKLIESLNLINVKNYKFTTTL